MDDADSVGLDETIAHPEAVSAARLDLALARTDGRLDVIVDRRRARAAATLNGLKQVWIGGLQVGEALEDSAAPASERQRSP